MGTINYIFLTTLLRIYKSLSQRSHAGRKYHFSRQTAERIFPYYYFYEFGFGL